MKITQLPGLMSLLFAIAFLMTSCQKDDDKLTTSEILLGDPWKITALTSDPAVPWYGETPVTDIYAVLDTCLKDDLMIFKSNGVLNFDEGQKKCAEEPEFTTAQYTLDQSQTVMTVKYEDDDTQQWTIKSIKDTKLVLTYIMKDDEMNKSYKFTATFTRN